MYLKGFITFIKSKKNTEYAVIGKYKKKHVQPDVKRIIFQ